MDILIVESDPNLGELWQRHMLRQDMNARLVPDQNGAIKALQTRRFDVLVLDLVLRQGSALAVADYAGFRHPDTQIVFVTNTSFFSDGSIFAFNANARAFLQSDMPPEDLTAMVAHYAQSG